MKRQLLLVYGIAAGLFLLIGVGGLNKNVVLDQQVKSANTSPTEIPTPTLSPTQTPTFTPTPTLKPSPTPIPTIQSTNDSGLSNDNYYTNTYGNQVHSPAYNNTTPAGATAICHDGTYSFSQSRRGTCSSHGGVSQWL